MLEQSFQRRTSLSPKEVPRNKNPLFVRISRVFPIFRISKLQKSPCIRLCHAGTPLETRQRVPSEVLTSVKNSMKVNQNSVFVPKKFLFFILRQILFQRRFFLPCFETNFVPTEEIFLKFETKVKSKTDLNF